jgi:hypothetical protein
MSLGSVVSIILFLLLPIRDADADLADLPAGEPLD